MAFGTPRKSDLTRMLRGNAGLSARTSRVFARKYGPVWAQMHDMLTDTERAIKTFSAAGAAGERLPSSGHLIRIANLRNHQRELIGSMSLFLDEVGRGLSSDLLQQAIDGKTEGADLIMRSLGFSDWDEMRRAVGDAQTKALMLAQTGVPAVNVGALDALLETMKPAGVTFAGPGADVAARTAQGNVRELFRSITASSFTQTNAAMQSLARGMALGRNPREVGRRLRKDLGTPLWRANTIARTEMMKSNRRSAIDRYAASPVVIGWIWVAQLDDRTCPICWAQHGVFTPIPPPQNAAGAPLPDDASENVVANAMDQRNFQANPFRKTPNASDFATHPNCRCSPVPQTKDWKGIAELAGMPPDVAETFASELPDSRVVVESGEEKFAKLSATQQRKILGTDRRFQTYHAIKDQGIDTPLDFLTQRTIHPKWGPTRSMVPAKNMPLPGEGAAAAVAEAIPEKALQDIAELFSKRPGARAALTGEVDEALDAIRSVHRIPADFAKVPLEYVTSAGGNVGSYRMRGIKGRTSNMTPDRIALNRTYLGPTAKRPGNDIGDTLVHEIGHAIDHQAFGPRRAAGVIGPAEFGAAGELTSAFGTDRKNPLLDGWWESVEKSESFKALSDPNNPVYNRGYKLERGELFARSYAQYIAMRGGLAKSAAFQQTLAGRRVKNRVRWENWDADDFAPIAREFDKLFSTLGWLV